MWVAFSRRTETKKNYLNKMLFLCEIIGKPESEVSSLTPEVLSLKPQSKIPKYESNVLNPNVMAEEVTIITWSTTHK